MNAITAQIHERLAKGCSLATAPNASRLTESPHQQGTCAPSLDSVPPGPCPVLDAHANLFIAALARIARKAVEEGRAPSIGQKETPAQPLTGASVTTRELSSDSCIAP